MADWQIAEYREVRELGRGAQGRVVLAQHAQTGTPVAIKYLLAAADERDRARFQHEARMLAQVRSPYVAQLYQVVDGEQGSAIVMEAVDGASLKAVLEQYRVLAPEAALTVLKGSLLGLAAAHEVGVVHRDYKPANVVVPADGRSKLIDFGIATPAGASSRAGTPYYMAPEQWENQPATPATDVYAATCVFYECVTGQRPYQAADQVGLMRGHLRDPIPLQAVPEPLRELVARGMAKQAGGRPPGAAVFVSELERTAREAYGKDWETRGVRALAAAAIALAPLFPLVAAGLAAAPTAGAAAAAGGTAATTGTGLLATTGAKITAAAVGTALAITAGAVAVQVVRAQNKPDPAPVAARPTLVGKPMVFAHFTLTVPNAWKLTPLMEVDRLGNRSRGESYRVDVPGRCTGDRRPDQPDQNTNYTTHCPGFAVLAKPWIDRQDTRGGYTPARPFHPATDIGHLCPPNPKKYPVAVDGKLVKQSIVAFGSRKAEYREWLMNCSGVDLKPSGVTFVQRLWYLPQSKILIVDEWNTPNLAKIVEGAVWR